MVRKHTRILFIQILLLASCLSFAQRNSIYQKATTQKEKAYYDSGESATAGNNKSIENYNEIEKEHNYLKKNFTNYTTLSNNYFRIDESNNTLWNGKHWENGGSPFKVYFKKSSSKNFKKKYKTYVDYALKIWEAAEERIKFEYTKSYSDADVVVSFEDNLMEKYNENYLGLTEYDIERKRKRIVKSYIEISLLKFDDKKVSDGEIKATIIHEFGHALGLGHSSNHADLMYPYISKDSSDELTYVELSTGDIEAIGSAVDLGYYEFTSK